MKVNPKFLMMMAALAAGSASAASTHTPAGTVISNTATATYTDPNDSTKTIPTDSNSVKTTVLPKANFDVLYTKGTPDANTYTTTPISEVTPNAVPGQEVPTEYAIVNTGNVQLTVKLAAAVGGDATAADVKYYRYDSTKADNRGTEITSTDTVTLPVDSPLTTGAGNDESLVKFIQVITVPASATPNNAYGASPEGSVVGTGPGAVGATVGTFTGNGIANGTTIYEEYGSDPSKAQGTDLQFVKVTLFTPSVNNNPNLPTPPTDPRNPDGSVYVPPTPPSGTSVTVPTSPTPVTPGYLDPGDTPIIDLAGDNQSAYPKVDNNDNNPDFVTFTNTLTNSGTQDDRLQLFPGGAVNPTTGALQNGWTFDAATATFTQNADTATELKVQFLAPGGSAIPVYAGTLGNPTDPAAKYPTIASKKDKTTYYQTKVTYPDPNDSGLTNSVVVDIDVDSLKDVGYTPETNGRTTNTIYPAAAQFGDFTAPIGTSANTSQDVINQKVKPTGINASNPNTALTVENDSTAIFLMDLVNNGQYSDSFILKGTVTVPSATPSGQPIEVKARYYDSTGALLPTNINGDYISPVVAAVAVVVGVTTVKEIQVVAVFDIPVGTPIGTYTVTQTAKGSYSNIAMGDANDTITVTPDGKLGVAKFVEKAGASAEEVTTPSGVKITGPGGYTSTDTAKLGVLTVAKPGDSINYLIIAKNDWNTAVKGFILKDSNGTGSGTNIYTYANFQSTSVTLTGFAATAKALFSIDEGTTWSETAPTSTTTIDPVKGIWVAVETDGVAGLTAADVVPSKATITLNINTTVK